MPQTVTSTGADQVALGDALVTWVPDQAAAAWWFTGTIDLTAWPVPVSALKPGAFAAVVADPAWADLLGVSLRLAGFEVRDSIAWLRPGSCGGTRLVLLGRRTPEGTVADTVTRWGVGGINIDGCRIPTQDRFGGGAKASGGFVTGYSSGDGWVPGAVGGRFPANLLLSHGPGCRRVGTRTVTGDKRPPQHGTRPGGFGNVGADSGDGKPAGPLYGDETVPVWACQPDCPVAALDRQSGTTRSAIGKAAVQKTDSAAIRFNGRAWSTPGVNQWGDEGGASRFFPCFHPR